MRWGFSNLPPLAGPWLSCAVCGQPILRARSCGAATVRRGLVRVPQLVPLIEHSLALRTGQTELADQGRHFRPKSVIIPDPKVRCVKLVGKSVIIPEKCDVILAPGQEVSGTVFVPGRRSWLNQPSSVRLSGGGAAAQPAWRACVRHAARSSSARGVRVPRSRRTRADILRRARPC